MEYYFVLLTAGMIALYQQLSNFKKLIPLQITTVVIEI
jgi:hypothetical protein